MSQNLTQLLVLALATGHFSPLAARVGSDLEFDVTSVKPLKECGDSQRFANRAGSLEVLAMQPSTLIRNAYHLGMEGQLFGIPKWADDQCFDVEARVEEPPGIELAKARERNLIRLQALMAKRFQLVAHWETKVQPGYVLLVDKQGFKLKPSAPETVHTSRNGRGTLICKLCPISGLSQFLSHFVDKPVQDETGIQGMYDIDLKWKPLDLSLPDDDGRPSLFTALADQLGLKLEPKKIAVQVLVVDHIEHPDAN